MAKKGTKRIRRSPEEKIADLKRQIDELQARQKAKELEESASNKAALNVVRMLDKALAVAKEEGNNALAHALADGREPIANHFEQAGVALPKARRPRGRRAKA
ncbi:MAG: hypothetical protein R3F34_09440 [Planctomycetota bacterium]